MSSLENKNVLITGASAGIGAACAEAFASAGANLILAARRKERLAKMAEVLAGKFGVKCHIMVLDVSNPASIDGAFDGLPVEWQTIDILINNAGLAKGVDAEWLVSLEDSDIMIDTNIKGLLYMTKKCVPGMIERDSGHVINLGSVAGREAYPGGSVYCATKFAVRALTRALKMDLNHTAIRVTSIDPGLVETEFSMVRLGDKVKAKQVYDNLEALRGEDIADAALYAATRPAHVNISEMLIFPTAQASARMVHREES